MEFLLELCIHRGLLGRYYAYICVTMHTCSSLQPVDARPLVPVNFVQPILSKFHA